MLRSAILLSLLPYTISTTKPYITFYWKTSAATDQFFDYWNHGPIFVPGLKNVYTITTRAGHIFPPWLTREASTTIETDIFKTKKFKFTKPSTSPVTTIATADTPIEIETTKTQPTPTEMNATHRPKPANQFSFEEAEAQGGTDPFSAFLRKFLRALSVKGHSELPPLFTPFSSYMTELITDGDLNQFGDTVLTYAKNMIKKLDGMILTPDKLHTMCYQAYNMLSNRHTAFEEDIDKLLNFLDDMYDEGEEEVMQIVLHEATKFPNTNATADEIAYGFINNVILLPTNRINGTSKGDSLVKMITAAVLKRNSSSRRHLSNTHREKKSRDNIELKNNKKRYLENKYKSIRHNLDNINSLIDNLSIPSSDTSAYEYELSEDDDSNNTKVKVNITKNTKNNQIHKFRTSNSDDDGESLLENDEDNKNMDYGQTDKVTPNIRSIFDNLQRFLSITDKSTVIPKESSIHFRFGNIQEYLNSESTVLFPNHLMTKLVKKRIQYDSVTTKHKTSRYAYFTGDRPKPVTKLSISTQQVHKLPKSQIKKEGDAEMKIKTDANNLARNNLIRHQYKLGSKDEALARMLLKRNPFYLDANEGSETLQPLQVITLKPLSNQITKHTPKTRITINMVTALRKKKIQNKQNIVKNMTQHSMNYTEHVKSRVKEENTNESDDSDTYSENSSETEGHKSSNNRKSKYEKLKRKYNILKRLSEQVLAQNMVNIKREQTTPGLIHTKVGEIADITQENDSFYNPVQKTTRNVHRKIKINNINLFLNDYDGAIEFESDSHETSPMANKVVYYNDIIRKSFPLSKTTDNSANVTALDYSDAEKELKRNMYDAIRHMDFINYNASRRNEDVKSVFSQDSHETDVEAVLKTNIYKAVKKLLKP